MKFDMLRCGACRTCEIACSFHHTGKFAPSLSSIRIHEKDRGQGNIVEFIEARSEKCKVCDGCPNENEPLCVEVCKEANELREMINEFLNKRIALTDRS